MQPPTLPPGVPWWQLGILLAALVTGALVYRLARPDGRWGLTLRKRFVMGVPWGTLIVVLFVTLFYLFVQDGIGRLHAPVVIPFRAWSYFYPLGILSAGVAHTGATHLTGNMLGTLAFGTLAEYAWGHFPRERGRSSFGSPSTNPFARIGAFVAASLGLALFTAAFSLGPVIGFSGVVFAYAGFAVVRLPVPTTVAILGSGALNLVYNALRRPVVPGATEPSFSGPWWANIAIQGHAIGFFAGVLLAVALVRTGRAARPNPLYLFVALVVFGADRGLWAVYTFLGNGRFELYRAGGVALLLLMAGLVTAAATASRRLLVSAIDLRSHEAAVGLTVAVLVALSVAAVPYNLVALGGEGVSGQNTVEVRDYTVYYTENATDRLVNAVEIPGIETGVPTSGVVVESRERNIWWTAYGERELAFAGERVVRLGGVGWRDSVVASRSGWSAVGGPTAYRIRLHQRGETSVVAYLSPDAPIEPRIRGLNLSIRPNNDHFHIVVTRGNVTLDWAVMPPENGTTSAAGLTFEREDGRVFAVDNDTRVRVATRERYR